MNDMESRVEAMRKVAVGSLIGGLGGGFVGQMVGDAIAPSLARTSPMAAKAAPFAGALGGAMIGYNLLKKKKKKKQPENQVMKHAFLGPLAGGTAGGIIGEGIAPKLFKNPTYRKMFPWLLSGIGAAAMSGREKKAARLGRVDSLAKLFRKNPTLVSSPLEMAQPPADQFPDLSPNEKKAFAKICAGISKVASDPTIRREPTQEEVIRAMEGMEDHERFMQGGPNRVEKAQVEAVAPGTPIFHSSDVRYPSGMRVQDSEQG